MLHDTYLTTDHGRQQLMYLTQESINPESGNHFTPEEAQREILHQLHATALKQKLQNIIISMINIGIG